MSSSFVDEVRISVCAGNGGDGAVAFLREKHRPRGGPNGGDGGRGGSVVAVADSSLQSLAPYVRRRTQQARNGGPGGPHDRHGADADDVEVAVPVGTVVRDAATKEVLADLAKAGTRVAIVRGGRGGRGNASLRSGRDRIPNHSEPGEPGEQLDVILELHLVADVGLLGPPNAGKSTLLGSISGANPKIADYPFTTLVPGLGVAGHDDERFVVADLPGLIEGAAEGKGLGLRFLRHAERCSVLAIVVDLAAADAAQDVDGVLREVATYQADLSDRVRVVVGNKLDLPSVSADAVRDRAAALGLRLVQISAAEGTNLDELLSVLSEEVARAQAERGEPESFAVFRPVVADPIEVVREDDGFRVRSGRVEQLVAQTSMSNPGAVRRLQQRLASLGVEAALRREGVKEGDEIRIGDVAFEYVPDVPPVR